MLAEAGGRLSLDQMDLLAAGVEPGTTEGEVGSVRSRLEAEDVAVEAERSLDVVDVEGNVMDSHGSHPAILSSPGAGVRGGGTRAGPAGSRGDGRSVSAAVPVARKQAVSYVPPA